MNELENLTILYVDDEEFIRDNAIDYLELYCNNVYGAKDGIEALELYKKLNPDIIITDIKMPRLNGIEMVKQIREDDKTTKIIIATAFLDTQYLLDSIELGLVKYLIKPITANKLLPVLQSCIEDTIDDKSIFTIDDEYKFDIYNKTLFKNQTQIQLTKKELYCLELFIKNQTRAVKFEEFNNYIWDGEMTLDALRTVIRELRNKISKQAIKSVSGIGYKLEIKSN